MGDKVNTKTPGSSGSTVALTTQTTTGASTNNGAQSKVSITPFSGAKSGQTTTKIDDNSESVDVLRSENEKLKAKAMEMQQQLMESGSDKEVAVIVESDRD